MSDSVTEDFQNSQQTYNNTKWLSLTLLVVTLFVALAFFLANQSSGLAKQIFGVSIIFLIPFFGYKKFKNLSRILLSFSLPTIIIVLSIINKTASLDLNIIDPINYFDTRFVLLSAMVIPISTISMFEKKLLILCLLPSFAGISLFDPIHNYFQVGYYQVGLLSNDYYFSSNLFSIVTYFFILGSLLYLKNMGQNSEMRYYRKGKMLERYLSKLIELGNSKNINYGKIDEALEEICLSASECLEINRVSIWKYDKEKDAIICKILYEENKVEKPNIELKGSDYPAYFDAVKMRQMIIAHDVHTHPATIKLKSGYQNGSLMDAPFNNNGEFGGVIGCESVGMSRRWSVEESVFLKALGDYMSYTLITYRLKRYNEELESKINERTKELEIKNNQLSEYAFINSHILRAPVARISGLVNLFDQTPSNQINELTPHLRASVQELDNITRKINSAIENYGLTDRNEIQIPIN